jgi:hypothetical protein
MRHLKHRTGLCLVLPLALTLLLAACGSPPPAATPTLAKGEFTESLSLGDFGLSTNGQQVIAYLCDGTAVHLSLAEWFKGTVTNQTIDLTNAHGSHLTATLTSQGVTGTITLKDGRSSSFHAPLIADPGHAYGLYRSEQTIKGVPYLGGWINNPPEQQANSSGGVQAFLTGPRITCCNPQDRGGIINEQTGALVISPLPNFPPDYPNAQVMVPNLGTFQPTLCRLGTC